MLTYALVTGASRGLGLSIAKALAAADNDVFVILGMRDPSSSNNIPLPTNSTVIALDVTSDESITAAVAQIEIKYHKLDILINNAGIATNGSNTDDLPTLRTTYTTVLSTNVTSVAAVTTAFLPLLQKQQQHVERCQPAAIINVSSARASLTRCTAGALPPSVSVPYSVSKAALSMLTVEMGKAYSGLHVYAASPGHLRTAFNGFRGKREPEEGARVVVELALGGEGEEGRRVYENGFWEFEDGRMAKVEW